jgi:hypothetical protein
MAPSGVRSQPSLPASRKACTATTVSTSGQVIPSPPDSTSDITDVDYYAVTSGLAETVLGKCRKSRFCLVIHLIQI